MAFENVLHDKLTRCYAKKKKKISILFNASLVRKKISSLRHFALPLFSSSYVDAIGPQMQMPPRAHTQDSIRITRARVPLYDSCKTLVDAARGSPLIRKKTSRAELALDLEERGRSERSSTSTFAPSRGCRYP